MFYARLTRRRADIGPSERSVTRDGRHLNVARAEAVGNQKASDAILRELAGMLTGVAS